jgi:radical SAM protein with 4Fe4S-binding SPASM domain
VNQEPPFAIQLEPTEGCSLACSFCGIQSIRDNGADADTGTHGKVSAPYKFMNLYTVAKVASSAKRLGWNPRWEFAMHGEPTLNKQLAEMVAVVRQHHPRGYIMVTSNGSGLLGQPGKIKALFDAGLNTLALDAYKHANFVQRLQQELGVAQVVDGIEVCHYPLNPAGNPHHRHHGKMISIVADISDNTSGTHQLTNQGGNSFAAEQVNLEQRCAKPFRELSVRWDGNVALCCDDWKGQYKIGNVNDTPLEALWNHPHFEAARRKLYAAQRDFGPCAGCNVRTYRNGLLPDKKGLQAMLRPNAETRQHIRTALRGKVYTIKLG